MEDFCESGLDDLKKGFLRTPLTPSETLNDDPLRALRIFRFSVQFGFTIDEEIS